MKELSDPEKYVLAFQAGAASRDAEIAELKVVSDHNLAIYHQAAELLRAEIATLKGMVDEIQAARHVQKEHNALLATNHQLREQVKLLRDTLAHAVLYVPDLGTVPGISQALAATEPQTHENTPIHSS